MKAYVVKKRDGAVAKGWLLRRGTSIGSLMCRLAAIASEGRPEEVPVEVAVRGAGRDQPKRMNTPIAAPVLVRAKP
jgi:hypothetical protein